MALVSQNDTELLGKGCCRCKTVVLGFLEATQECICRLLGPSDTRVHEVLAIRKFACYTAQQHSSALSKRWEREILHACSHPKLPPLPGTRTWVSFYINIGAIILTIRPCLLQHTLGPVPGMTLPDHPPLQPVTLPSALNPVSSSPYTLPHT